MTGWPTAQALLFAMSVLAIIAAIRARFHPFFVFTVVATAFGLLAGLSVGPIGKAFGSGFSDALYSPGLVIVAMALVAGIAERTVPADNLAAVTSQLWPHGGWVQAAVGLIAGIGASSAAALALLTPLLPSADTKPSRERDVTCLTLAISAGHGLIYLSPVPVASAAILGAGWQPVVLFGVPVALISAAIGIGWARLVTAPHVSIQPTISDQSSVKAKPDGKAAALLLAACFIPLLMLMTQSIGDMPSEPLGGGTSRELVLGIGRPLALFLISVGIVIVGSWRVSLKCLRDPEWIGRTLGNTAGIILIVGAAGGLQRLCQQTGMSELLGERLSGWHVTGAAGVLVPFLVATVIKTLQGSSLVAAITTAGMMQPLLLSLGLGSENGTALAALAVGVGAMTGSHVNDDFFWLASHVAEESPLRTLGTFSLGTLLQGFTAAAVLLLFAVHWA